MKTRRILILLCLPLLIKANPIEKLKFFDGSLESAKSLAAQEGKLYFIEFSAKWCTPCKVMEETTFSDPVIIDYIERYYIPVKADIDNFDGIALKQTYGVHTIPTVIFFNSQGELLEKFEKNLPASTMLTLLKKHNTAANRLQNRNYKQESSFSVNNELNNSSVAGIYDRSASNDAFQNKVKVKRRFSIQVGTFGSYEHVRREAERLGSQYASPLRIYSVEKSGKTVYKLMIGEFSSHQAAKDFYYLLKDNGLEGIIQDMTTPH